MRFLFSLLIIFALLIVPAMAQASDSCFSKNCTVSVDGDNDTASKSQSDTKSVKADHCCACAGCYTFFHASLQGTSGIEQLQEKPLLTTASLSGLGPQSPLEPPRTI